MKTVEEFKTYLINKGKDSDWTKLADMFLPEYWNGLTHAVDPLSFGRRYSEEHIAGREDALRKIILLYWYHDLNGDKALSTYFVTLLGTLDVLDNQRGRMEQMFGKEKSELAFSGLRFPVLGEDLCRYPDSISRYLQRMSEVLTPEECKAVLAGNHHGIDVSGFASEKEHFLAAPDLPAYLREKHARLVKNLQEHCDSGKLWFEQHITQEVVDYVQEHQEIQTGILEGNSLIVMKIPYNPASWLSETDPLKKRYYACHCPFVRASIPGGEKINSIWCYCSGGFTKLLMDYLYERELEVELLDSALDKADYCRFAIKLP